MQGSEPGSVTLSIAVQRQEGRLGVDPFYNDFVTGMEDRLRSARGSALLRMVDDVHEEIADYRRWAADRRIDGVVLHDFVADDSRVAIVRELGLAAVLLGGDASSGLPTIDVDNVQAMNDAVAYLVGLGHRRIGRVAGPEELVHTKERTVAFVRALDVYGVQGATADGDYGEGGGAAATRDLLTAAEPPTAIIYDNAEAAVAGLEAAKSLGVALPQQLSLLAWDDSADCQVTQPPLSVMDRDVRSLGYATASALLDVIAGRAVSVVKASDAVVVERGTTAPPPAG
ncbi:substrate-binding domain-containing protein [Humibacter sp.]|uniref:LacI family DNA-binding transcriptional regulator n=1 Tax=Humibacter sp. TaxID=1940291 RepID=UPI002B8BD96B|nr:substrate-binding domain-containing protein [Humibacter sp.]HVX07632.1 substrate-binding domain-containing protein [Humibacter sp.]